MAKRINDIVEYFKDLCVNHPLLAHDEAVGSRIFEVIAYEEAFGDFRTAATEKGYFVRLIMPTMGWSKKDDNAWKEYQCGLLFGKSYSSRESAKTAKIQAWDAAERIADDFVARMVYDSRDGHSLFNSTIDQVANMELSGDYMDAAGDGAYAAVMIVFNFKTFRCFTPTGSDFVAAGWLDL